MTMPAALAELRARPGRFAAVLLAIAVGVGFAAGTLVLTTSYRQALGRAVAADVSRIDVVVTADAGALDLTRVTAVTGVGSVEPAETGYVYGTGRATRGYLKVSNIPVDPAARWYTLRTGRWPAGAAEMAVDQDTATRNNWTAGSIVLLAPAGSLGPTTRVNVTAIVDTSVSPLASTEDAAYGPLALLDSLAIGPADTANVIAAPGQSPEQVAATLDRDLAGTATATTSAEVTRQRIAAIAGNPGLLDLVLAAFLALAALVATMVVATTFTIVLTGRRRQIALLRCVGATTGQVRRMILAEASVLGLAGSVLGIGAGLAGGRAAGSVAGIAAADFRIDLAGLLGIGLAGAVVTVVAALAPIARATRIPPVAAIRPVESDERLRQVGRLRLAVGAALLVGGGGLLVGGVVVVDLAAAIGGGALTAIGVVVSLRAVVPVLVRALSWAGRRFGRHGPSGMAARLAVANILRHPGRAASSCAVLVIGVGAVITLLVSCDSAQAGADRAAAQSNPLDLALAVPDAAVPTGLLGSIAAIDGVRSAVQVSGTTVRIGGNDLVAYGPSAGLLDEVVSTDRLQAGQVALPAAVVEELDLSPGDPVTVTRGSRSIRLAVAGHALTNDGSVVLLAPDLLRLEPQPAITAVWARFDASAEPNEVISRVNPVIAPMTTVTLSGSGVQRAATAETLDTLIRVALGLLAFTVLIALIGIGNTLSLSVAERTRESALLRALGLRRGQLRSMLAWEAAVLALLAAGVGTVFGVLFGWAAVSATFGAAGHAALLRVPWRQVVLVIGGTLAAGVLASILPGRRAAQTTPVQALVAG